MRHNAAEIVRITGGGIMRGDGSSFCQGFSTDTRTIKPGQGLIALIGERYDAHRFLEQAVKKRAGLLIIQADHAREKIPGTTPVIAVSDTLHALGDLAADWRRRFYIDVIAVTGSTGKTTTKEMIAHILAGYLPVLRNEGNLNNLVGLPMSIFNMSEKHQVAVLEMGMNRPGEIARLTEIAAPDVGLITNVAPVHIEGVGSLAGVARAKAELIQTLNENAVFIVNLDDPRILEKTAEFKGRLLGFSMARIREKGNPEDRFTNIESIRLERAYDLHDMTDTKTTPTLEFSLRRYRKDEPLDRPVFFRIKSHSLHDMQNALAAATAAYAVGVSLEESAERLGGYKGLAGRAQVRRLPDITIIDDTYNANPLSVEMALRSMNKWKGAARGIAVLGEMQELGQEAAAWHRRTGKLVAELGVSLLIVRGDHAEVLASAAIKAGMKKDQVTVVKTNQDAADILSRKVEPGDWVLVKGSRTMYMEEVVEEIIKRFRVPNSRFNPKPHPACRGARTRNPKPSPDVD